MDDNTRQLLLKKRELLLQKKQMMAQSQSVQQPPAPQKPSGIQGFLEDYGNRAMGQVKALGDVYNTVREPVSSVIKSQSPGLSALNKLNANFKSYSVPDLALKILAPGVQTQPLQNYNTREMAGQGADLLADQALTMGLLKGVPVAAKGYAGRMSRKAAELTTKIVPPQPGTISEATKFGRDPLEYGKRLSKYVKKSKDYPELAKAFQGPLAEQTAQRNALVSEAGNIPDLTYFDEALGFLKDLETTPMVSPAQRKNIGNLLTQEIDFINNLSPEQRMNASFLQSRKSQLQKIAQDLYGNKTELSPLEQLGKKLADKLQSGYQRLVESVDPRVESMNKELGALIQGNKAASELAEVAMTTRPTGNINNQAMAMAAGAAGKPAYMAANVAKEFAKNLSKLKGETASIERMVGRGKFSQGIADLIEGILKPKAKPVPTGLPQIGYTPPAPAQIGYDRQPFFRRMLPQGASTGKKPIKAGYDPSRVPIELPELTQTQLDELAAKWGQGVSRPREIVELTPPSSAWTKGVKSPPSKKMSKTIREFMERRKRNFPS